MNCFAKAGISKDQQVTAINDDDDLFNALTEEIEGLKAQKPDLSPGFTYDNLMNGDDGLVCKECDLTDEDIIEEFAYNDDDSERNDGSDEEDDDVQVLKPTKTSVYDAIDTLLTYAMFAEDHGDEISRLASRISALLDREWIARKKQQSIETYFKP